VRECLPLWIRTRAQTRLQPDLPGQFQPQRLGFHGG
jgi:hypothetical protein